MQSGVATVADQSATSTSPLLHLARPQPHVAVYLTSLLMAEAAGEEDGEGDGDGE